MTHRHSLANYDDHAHGLPVWSILGAVALAALAVVVISSMPDIKRYIRINNM